ncbi:Glycogenin-1, partial [Halocaridina rubra]
PNMPEAYVTLATNDGYAVGALVLGHSLRSVDTTRDLCIMITPGVSPEIRTLLQGVFSNVVTVDVLNSNDSAHLSLLKRPELGVTFTKLHCWTLTQYSKCVFLDADILAVQNPDDLFAHPELTAVCDIGWPDCFNSGMFVFVPSLDTYGQLLHHAEVSGSFDGGDQGVLNTYFPKWHRISFIYNMVASVTYTYLPAYKQYGGNAKLVHFLGALKPWQHRYDSASGTVYTSPGYQHLTPYLNSWWAIYTRLVKPGVPELVEQQLGGMTIGTETAVEGRERWERGEPDYLGRDSFANIQAYIDAKIKANGK